MCLDVREWLELGRGGALSCDSMALPPEEGRGMDLSTQQLGERQWLSAELRVSGVPQQAKHFVSQAVSELLPALGSVTTHQGVSHLTQPAPTQRGPLLHSCHTFTTTAKTRITRPLARNDSW